MHRFRFLQLQLTRTSPHLFGELNKTIPFARSWKQEIGIAAASREVGERIIRYGYRSAEERGVRRVQLR